MTIDELTKKIKNRLGYPAIDIELSDEQIALCIEDALDVVKDYISTRELITVNVQGSAGSLSNGYNGYVDLSIIEDLDEVIDVYRADNLSWPFMYDEFNVLNYARRGIPARFAIGVSLRSNAEAMLNRNWKRVGSRLYLDKYYSQVTVEYTKIVKDVSQIVDSFYLRWVLQYSIACCKEILGRVRGKMVVDSNPFKMDQDALLSESAAEKAALEEQLKDHDIPDPVR